MNAMVLAMNSLVSISAFNKGDAGKIFSAVKASGLPKIVLRRNEPECVLISPAEYSAMVQELEDLRDYKLAVERLAAVDPGSFSTWQDMLRESGLTQADVDAMEDVELE